MSTGILAWEKPSDSATAKSTTSHVDYDAVAAALQSKPGKWALVKEYPTTANSKDYRSDPAVRASALSASSDIRRNRLPGFEVATGATRSGLLGIFARAV